MTFFFPSFFLFHIQGTTSVFPRDKSALICHKARKHLSSLTALFKLRLYPSRDDKAPRKTGSKLFPREHDANTALPDNKTLLFMCCTNPGKDFGLIFVLIQLKTAFRNMFPRSVDGNSEPMRRSSSRVVKDLGNALGTEPMLRSFRRLPQICVLRKNRCVHEILGCPDGRND